MILLLIIVQFQSEIIWVKSMLLNVPLELGATNVFDRISSYLVNLKCNKTWRTVFLKMIGFGS